MSENEIKKIAQKKDSMHGHMETAKKDSNAD